MAVADILSTIRGFVTSSSKSHNEFKSESNKNNRNISNAIRDISKMFSTQKSINQKNESSLANILDITQTTSSTTQQNNDLLKESISLQNDMLKELKKINTGVGSLIQSFESSSTNNQNQGGIGSAALRAAGAALGIGAVAVPGLLNNFFGREMAGGNIINAGGLDTSGNNLRVSELRKIAKEAGFNDEEAKIMAAIAASESSGNPTAHNPDATTDDNSYGLWQINMIGPMGPERRAKLGIQSNEELFDAKKNAEAAFMVYKEQGFSAWSDYTNEKYLNYLPEADDSFEVGQKPAEGPEFGGLKPNSSPTGGGGNVFENQASDARIRKQPINEKLKEVLKQAAAMAGVDVVIHSGGQPSKASGGGPRTGSTRHDDGNAADLYLQKDGKILRDPEDRETMSRFVSAATQYGATGIGFGAPTGQKDENGNEKYSYMGPSSIHVGFGKPATWGGSPWIAQAAAGVFSNPDLSSPGGAGGVMSDIAASAMESLNAAFALFGVNNADPANFLSSFFGIPLAGADVKKDESGKESYGPSYEEEAQEGKDSLDITSIGGKKTEAQKPLGAREKDDKGFINYENFGNLADQIKEASMMINSSPIVVNGTNFQTSSNSPEREVMTDFGASGNQPRNTRASWAPRIAVLRPDEKVTESIRWAARISPNLMT